MPPSISSIIEQIDRYVPEDSRSGVLSALRHPVTPGAKAASLLVTEALLRRSNSSLGDSSLSLNDVIIPDTAAAKLSKQQQRVLQRHAHALANRTGLNPDIVVEHLLTELALLTDKGTKEVPTSQPNLTAVLTNLRDRNVFQIKEEFDSIINAFKSEPNIARTAATLVMHQKRYASGAEAFEAYTSAKRDCLALFGADELTRDIVLTAAGLVFQGRFADARGAYTRYRAILDEALPLFSTDPEMSKVAYTIAHRVLCGKLDSPQAGLNLYSTLLRLAREKFGGTEETEGVTRTAALLILTQRYKNIDEAYTTYCSLLDEAREQLGALSDTRSAKTAAIVVFKKEFPSITDFIKKSEGIKEEVTRIFSQDPEAAAHSKTAVAAVLRGKYPSAQAAYSRLREIIPACAELFSARTDTQKLTSTAISAVFFRTYKTPESAFNALVKHISDTQRVFCNDARTAPFARLAAYLLFQRVYSTAEEAHSACLAVLEEVREHEDGDHHLSPRAPRLVFKRLAGSLEEAEALLENAV